MDDAQLAAGAIAGRQECFDTLVERHQRMVHALVYRWPGDHAGADEVVQATFVQAYTHLVDFRADASFRSWLHGIAVNQVRPLQRTRRRDRTVPLADLPEGDLPQGDDVPVGGRLRDRLVASMGRLCRGSASCSRSGFARLEGIRKNSAKVSDQHAVTRLREWLRRG